MMRANRQSIENLKTIGLSRRQIAWVFHVCKRTIQRWATSVRSSGLSRGRPPKLLPMYAQWVYSQLCQNPYLTQAELASELSSRFGISVHRSTIARFLKTNSWTKKVPVRAPMACHEQKAEQWLATFQATPRTGKLMSLDETAFVVGKVGPSRGYSPQGKPIVQRHNPQARKMFSLLVCLEETTPRPVHWVLMEGAITGPRFQEFLATMPANLQGWQYVNFG